MDLPNAWVADVVTGAEVAWQRDLPLARELLERAQSVVARVLPSFAALNNSSFGRANIRPEAAARAIAWARESGIAEAARLPDPADGAAVTAAILDPARSDLIVTLILARLRDDHPLLQSMEWEAIEADDLLVAKLYSGYMGAGGAWVRWRATLDPGPEALRRLGCTPGQGCREVERHRP